MKPSARLGGRGRRRPAVRGPSLPAPSGPPTACQATPRVTGARIVAKNSGPSTRVGLGADFGVGASTKWSRTMSSNVARRSPEQRWRPATPHTVCRRCVNSGRQFRPAAPAATVGLTPQLGRGVGIEVTQPATGQAEQDVPVNGCRAWAPRRLSWCLPKYHARACQRVPAKGGQCNAGTPLNRPAPTAPVSAARNVGILGEQAVRLPDYKNISATHPGAGFHNVVCDLDLLGLAAAGDPTPPLESHVAWLICRPPATRYRCWPPNCPPGFALRDGVPASMSSNRLVVDQT